MAASGRTKLKLKKLLKFLDVDSCLSCLNNVKNENLNHRKYFILRSLTNSEHKQVLKRCSRTLVSGVTSSKNHTFRPLALQHCNYSTTSLGYQERVDPFKLVQDELDKLCTNINHELRGSTSPVEDLASYHFDGQGKAVRPMTVLLMSKAINDHNGNKGSLLSTQRKVAEIAEMIHVASLVHDDVVDASDMRRGKASVQQRWGQRKAIMAGNYILSVSSISLARIRNEEVVTILSQVLEDLVRGEFMQLGSKENEGERFNHYLRKTYKKTASLMANSCKAVAVLGQSTDDIVQVAFQYGRNLGIAFQLVDDLLDFTSSETMMGKPAAADLKLGLATAPVLFAAEQFPDLNSMIMRRFGEPGDVEAAREFVRMSDGISHTRYLAEEHCKEAIRQIRHLTYSREREGLVTLTNKVLNRLK